MQFLRKIRIYIVESFDANCDFENGTCGWRISSNEPDYIFKVKQASAGSLSSKSQSDHTTGNNTGHFLEASGGN